MNAEGRGADVMVVGGGAIGLACARAVAAQGGSVIVLEQGRTGAEATRAAGGMLVITSYSIHYTKLYER